jgi:hypothetical protein
MKFLILSFTLLITSIVPGFSQKAEELSPAHLIFTIPAGREQSLSGMFKPQFWRLWQEPDGIHRTSDGPLLITISKIPMIFVRSKPYAAEETIQETWTKTDGTRTSRTLQPTLIYRDSAGRTRVDWPAHYPSPKVFNQSFAHENDIFDLVEAMGGVVGADRVNNLSTIPEINDPVAGSQYYLDSLNRVAYRFSLPPSIPNLPSSIPSKKLPHEFLGTKTIVDVEVQGIRYTTTIDASKTITTESWVSNELMIGILRKSSFSNYGEIIQTLKNIKRVEPDAALFKIPSDYKIVDGPQ